MGGVPTAHRRVPVVLRPGKDLPGPRVGARRPRATGFVKRLAVIGSARARAAGGCGGGGGAGKEGGRGARRAGGRARREHPVCEPPDGPVALARALAPKDLVVGLAQLHSPAHELPTTQPPSREVSRQPPLEPLLLRSALPGRSRSGPPRRAAPRGACALPAWPALRRAAARGVRPGRRAPC